MVSRNQKTVTDGFPWTLGTEPKNCFQGEFKFLGLEYIAVLNNNLEYSLDNEHTVSTFMLQGP